MMRRRRHFCVSSIALSSLNVVLRRLDFDSITGIIKDKDKDKELIKH